MSKASRNLTGRPATDDRGNATSKWTGAREAKVDGARVRPQGEGSSCESMPQELHLDPYNQPVLLDKAKTKGRSLDDMRRLNDEMKREHANLLKRLGQRTPRKNKSHPQRGMRLWFDDRELLVEAHHTSITIGRAGGNDVVLTGERISRLHARIKISRNEFVLVDQSRNGTFVQTANGELRFARGRSLLLKGQGIIGLGRRPGQQGSPHTIRFTCEQV